MPIVDISIATGRSPDVLRNLIHEVTRTVAATLGAPPESVRVILRQVPPELWAAGDVTLAERQSQQTGRQGGTS